MFRFPGLLGRWGDGLVGWKENLNISMGMWVAAELLLLDFLLESWKQTSASKHFLEVAIILLLPIPWMLLRKVWERIEGRLKGLSIDDSHIADIRGSVGNALFTTYFLLFSCSLLLNHLVIR